jgi:hypothetical protein
VSGPIPGEVLCGVQPGSLCLRVVRQTLPGSLPGSHGSHSRPLTLRRKAVSTEPLSGKVVWPDKCYCTGVNVAPIVEMLNATPAATRPASLAQVADQPPQTFKESLLAASRASSDTGSGHEDVTRTGRRQNPAPEDAKSPHATLHSSVVLLPAPPQQTVQQQAPPARQLPLIDPAPVVPLQLPPAGAGESPHAATVPVDPTRDSAVLKFPPIGSNIDQPAVAKSDNISTTHVQKQGDPPQAALMLPSVGYESQAATNLSTAVLNPPSNTVPGDAGDSTPGVVPGVAQSAASSPFALSVSSALQPPHPDVAPTLVPVTFGRGVSDTVANAVPDVTPRVAPTEVPDVVQHSASPLTAGSSLDATPVPISHGAVSGSAKGDVAPQSSLISANQANPPAASPNADGLATVPSAPDATAGQLVALIQPDGGLIGAAQAGASGVSLAAAKPSDVAVVNSKDGVSNSINDVTGLKQHAQSASTLASSQPVSQETPSGDQSQGGASQQGQNAATAQLNFPNHTIAAGDHAQNPGVAVLSQAAPAPAGASDHTAKTPQTAPPATIVLPQAVPVINTAKLIQSMGQSEMRVGMRSTDFGNISISTSATRDLISAQISLEHGELARTLATHLPEMQAKFGGNQAMNVRIDMNGQPAGQGAGTSAGMSNGSADQSRGDRQQRSSGPSRQSDEGFAGQLNSIPVAVLPSVESRLDLRLDIRV